MPRLVFLLVCCLGLAVAAPAFAQEGKERPTPAERKQKRKQLARKLKQLRAKMLREEVRLSPAQAKTVERILDETGPKRRKLRKQIHHHQRIVMHLLEAGSEDDEAYKRAIGVIRDSHRRLHELRQAELDELAKHLRPHQMARLMATTHKMKKRIRRKLRKRNARGAGPAEIFGGF